MSRALHLAAVSAAVSVVLAGLSACGAPTSIAQADYARMTADVTCDRIRECERGAFESLFFGLEDCRVEFERQTAETIKLFDDLGCAYDAKKAADTWVLIHDMSCENFFEGEYADEQNEVWGEDCFGE